MLRLPNVPYFETISLRVKDVLKQTHTKFLVLFTFIIVIPFKRSNHVWKNVIGEVKVNQSRGYCHIRMMSKGIFKLDFFLQSRKLIKEVCLFW